MKKATKTHLLVVFWWFFFVLTKMPPTQVLAHLQRMFPDRLVLYAEDLAQVLGKSRKAVTHLLSQDHLPFKVKHLGPERCIDIFQVAEWLASDADVAEAVSVPEPALSTTVSSGKVPFSAPTGPENHQTATSYTPQSAPVSDPAASVADYGLMGKRILEMRHDYQRRFVAQVLAWEGDEQMFMHDLVTHLCMSPSLPVESFELVCTWMRWVGAGYERKEEVVVVPDEASVREALPSLLRKVSAVPKDVVDVRVRHAGQEVFRLVRNLEETDVLLDDYKFFPF